MGRYHSLEKYMKIYLIFAFTILLSSFCFCQISQSEQFYVFYPNKVGVIQSCSKSSDSFTLEIRTNSEKPIDIFSFKLMGHNFVILSNNIPISKSDTIRVSSNNQVNLIVKYTRTEDLLPKTFSFKTNNKEDSNCVVNIHNGEYFLNSRNLKKDLIQEIEISKSCSDSIKVFFPYGGTMSDVKIFKDSITIDKPLESISYFDGEETNFIMFSKKNLVTYYVHYGSCYSSSKFWLKLK
jgi:uncharacterized protein YneR